MKQVIVTGANGFVGSHIVTAFVQAGWYVYATDIAFDDQVLGSWDTDRVELIAGSCLDLPAISADGLVHAAFITASAEIRNETPVENLHANLDPMFAMMTYTEVNHIPRSVFISSSAVFRHIPNTLIDEERPRQPLGTYAVAKTMMENFVETMRTLHDRDMICVRLSSVYGHREVRRASRPTMSVVGTMLHDAIHTGTITLTNPEESREWTYAVDIGEAIVGLMKPESLRYSLYNLASGKRYSNRQIAEVIQAVLDVEIELAPNQSENSPPLPRLGILDTSRLASDIGFSDWTPLDTDTISSIVADYTRSEAYA